MPTLSIFNHIIRQNPETQAVLAGYNGIVLTIRAAGFTLHGRFNSEGLLEHSPHAADAVLVFRDSVLRKMLNGQQPGVGDFEIEGDMALGFRLLTVIGGLRYRADRDLSRLFGEEAAERIGGRGRKIAGTLKSIGRSLLEQGADFPGPESPVVSRENSSSGRKRWNACATTSPACMRAWISLSAIDKSEYHPIKRPSENLCPLGWNLVFRRPFVLGLY